MKYSALLCLVALGCSPAVASADETSAIGTATEKEKALLTSEQIDELLAPVALYPDPLIAIILPASTFPTDIVLAARYLQAGKSAEGIEDQAWDDSVKALARYPEVLKWMDENLAWTQQLGSAFTLQPVALLNGTQRLRASAIAAGTLKDSPEQTVLVEREVIRIVPAQREVIYVPVYDPVYVYRPRVVDLCHPGPLVTFSVGYRTGFWLSYHCDWGFNTVVVVNRPYRTVFWHETPAWSCPRQTVVYQHHTWRPAPVRVIAARRDFGHCSDHRIARPSANTYVQRGPERDRSARDSSSVADFGHRQNRSEGVVVAANGPSGAGQGITATSSPSVRDREHGRAQTVATGRAARFGQATEITPRRSESSDRPELNVTGAPSAPAGSGAPISSRRSGWASTGNRNSRALESASAAPESSISSRSPGLRETRPETSPAPAVIPAASFRAERNQGFGRAQTSSVAARPVAASGMGSTSASNPSQARSSNRTNADLPVATSRGGGGFSSRTESGAPVARAQTQTSAAARAPAATWAGGRGGRQTAAATETRVSDETLEARKARDRRN